jgi:hypothetical protein
MGPQEINNNVNNFIVKSSNIIIDNNKIITNHKLYCIILFMLKDYFII